MAGEVRPVSLKREGDGLAVEWSDGVRTFVTWQVLRKNCPCASCLEERGKPADPFRVELTAPDGELWVWGPADAAQRVTGPALDFCLLMTQRRHRDDLALGIEGPAATEWMAIAQAFAGAAGTGRPRSANA